MVAHYRHLRRDDSQRKMQQIDFLGQNDGKVEWLRVVCFNAGGVGRRGGYQRKRDADERATGPKTPCLSQ